MMMFCNVSNNEFKNKLETFRQKIKKNIENEIFMDQINIECSCCYSSKFVDDFECCKLNHKICKDCIKTYATNTIFENGSYNIKCIYMIENCDCIYDENTLKNILDKKVFEQYLKLKIKDEIKDIITIESLNIIKCQFCETYWDIDPNDKILYCMSCSKKTCLSCNQLAHPDRPCDKIRIKIEDALTKQNFLICSNCSRCIFKESGCNAVRCPCGNNMCWGCKKSWGATDAHRCDCGNLWGGVQTNYLNEFNNDAEAQNYINKIK